MKASEILDSKRFCVAVDKFAAEWRSKKSTQEGKARAFQAVLDLLPAQTETRTYPSPKVEEKVEPKPKVELSPDLPADDPDDLEEIFDLKAPEPGPQPDGFDPMLESVKQAVAKYNGGEFLYVPDGTDLANMPSLLAKAEAQIEVVGDAPEPCAPFARSASFTGYKGPTEGWRIRVRKKK